MIKKISKIINKEIESNFADKSEMIKENIDWNSVKRVNMSKKSNLLAKRKKNSGSRLFWRVAVPSFAILCMCFAVLLPIFVNQNFDTSYTLTISINPKVELKIDEKRIVTAQKGLNEDGVKLLYRVNLVGLPAENATETIVKLASNYGLLKNDNHIKILASGKNDGYINDEYAHLKNAIEDYIQLENISTAGIEKISLTEFEDIYNYYRQFDEKTYEEDISISFKTQLIDVLTLKISDITKLCSALAPFSDEGSDDKFADEKISQQVKDFADKYKSSFEDLSEIDLYKLSFKDIFEILEQLTEELNDYGEILTELQGGADEDDYEQQLEDLIDIAKELLFDD